jgi:hypothetical protein
MWLSSIVVSTLLLAAAPLPDDKSVNLPKDIQKLFDKYPTPPVKK